jgi:hypothetical protein
MLACWLLAGASIAASCSSDSTNGGPPLSCAKSGVALVDTQGAPLTCAEGRFLSSTEEQDHGGDYVTIRLRWTHLHRGDRITLTAKQVTVDGVFESRHQLTDSCEQYAPFADVHLSVTATVGECNVWQKVAQGSAGAAYIITLSRDHATTPLTVSRT